MDQLSNCSHRARLGFVNSDSLVLLKIVSLEIKVIPNTRQLAVEELNKMESMSFHEQILATVFVMCLALWATSSLTGISATPIAKMAVIIMLISKILRHFVGKRRLECHVLNGQLDGFGHGSITWITQQVDEIVQGVGFSWMTAFVLILLFYTYAHYCFTSVTAHISAMYSAFIVVAVACRTPPLMAALTFGFFANCPISLTHYGNGCSPVYYGTCYVSQSEWWRNGFAICTMNVAI